MPAIISVFVMKLAELAARMFIFWVRVSINLTLFILLSFQGEEESYVRGASSLQPSHDKRLLF